MPAAEQSPDLAGDLALIVDAARQAGEIAMRFFGKSPEVWLKGGMSPVSEADYAVDKFLRQTLLEARPDYGWLSEETADGIDRLSTRRVFIVDPIDGTRGFLERQTSWCVSVAVVENGFPIVGVLECPARQETFSASLGGGGWLGGRRLAVREPGGHPEVGGPKSLMKMLPANLAERLRRVAYVPSLAYRLAMIADGRFDAAIVGANSHDWDLAAADLLVHEAGGRILDARGNRPTYGGTEIEHGEMVAGSGELLDTLVRAIRPHG